jgi:hypothetical protein
LEKPQIISRLRGPHVEAEKQYLTAVNIGQKFDTMPPKKNKSSKTVKNDDSTPLHQPSEPSSSIARGVAAKEQAKKNNPSGVLVIGLNTVENACKVAGYISVSTTTQLRELAKRDSIKKTMDPWAESRVDGFGIVEKEAGIA